jgi:hypothetical protein
VLLPCSTSLERTASPVIHKRYPLPMVMERGAARSRLVDRL